MRIFAIIATVVIALTGPTAWGPGSTAWAPGSTAWAQGVQRIAAVVNDDVISIFDVRQRSQMVIFTSGIEDTEENRRRIAAQVLRTLIDERLQMQEAKKRSISVSKRDLSRGVAAIEQQNSMEPGQLKELLQRNGIRYQAMLDQMRAGIAWQKLVRRRLGPRVSIGDEEVAEVIARLKATKGQDEYRLAEIFLAVDSPNDEAAIRGTAERMVQQVRNGAKFSALAREFSQSATAAVGGDIGWAARSEIDPAFVQAVAKVEEGAVLDPIRTPSGYRIITLTGKRKVATADPKDIKIRLQQVFMPIGEGSAEGDIAARIDRAKSARDSVSRCEDAAALAQRLDSEAPQDLGTLNVADLSPQIRKAVIGLKVGSASEPIRVPNGLVMLVVCDRQAPTVSLPDTQTVSDQLRGRRLDLMARRYLRDLRRAAVIDVRV